MAGSALGQLHEIKERNEREQAHGHLSLRGDHVLHVTDCAKRNWKKQEGRENRSIFSKDAF